MTPTYYDQWASHEGLLKDYPYAPPAAQLVYAGYTYEDYSGDALVVWVDADGQWWENNDGHCSCHGLENWNPEPTTPEALLMRPNVGYRSWPGLHEAINTRLKERV